MDDQQDKKEIKKQESRKPVSILEKSDPGPEEKPGKNESATETSTKKAGPSKSPGKKGSVFASLSHKSLPQLTAKVSPAPSLEPFPTLLSSETKLVKQARSPASPGNGLALTVLPSRAAFTGGLAVSATKQGRPSASKSLTNLSKMSTTGSETDGLKIAATHYQPHAKNKSQVPTPKPAVYEVKMPGLPTFNTGKKKRSAMEKNQFSDKAHINPRTLGSLVETLRAIYGTNFHTGKHKKKKKTKKAGAGADADESESDEEDKKGLKAVLNEDGAEALSMKLYGNQSDVINEFLAERRDCERELVFEEATFPRWVTILWKVHFIYEFITSCFLLISVFYGAYAAVFRNHVADTVFLESLSLFIEVDVILRLLVEVWRSWTKCQYEVFSVNYTFFLALLDAVGSVPAHYYYMYFVRDGKATFDDLRWIPLFSLLNLCHAFRMTTILNKLENDMNIRGHAKFIVSIIRCIIQYVLVVHVLACVMFYVGQKSYIDWLLNRDPEQASDKQLVTFLSIRSRLAEPPDEFYSSYPDPLGLYILSLYLVVATISTVGLGDFFAVNNTERILIIVMMMVGSIWISGELAYKLGTFFTDLDASRYMMFFRVKCIKIHLQNYRVSNFICKRTENYYKHLWRYRKGVHEIDLTYLPHCVQEEIKFDICEEMFYKSPIFRGLDETFLMGLAKTAKVSLYSPRMILFERGSITKQMCFVLQGEVAVAAGLSDEHISAIHRAGCLIGEINLFMSLPYEQTIYTRTVCTVMTIAKKDLMLSLQDFPHIFAIMRDRLKERRDRYRNAFNLVQAHPYVQWMYPKSTEDLKPDPEFPVQVNNMRGWRNAPITSYPMEDEGEQVIIEMPCLRDDLKRVESLAYKLVSVPEIYYDPGYVLTMVNAGFLGLWFYLGWMTPACWTFDDFQDTYFSSCISVSSYWPLICLACLADLIVEVFLACPSTGIYYKIKDGLTVKLRTFGFYCDLLSIIPFELFYHNWLSAIARMVLKVWKIVRFWEFLDERFAIKLFYIRILKMTYYLLYLTFVIALWLICLVCEPGRGKECNEISFFNPSYPESRWNRVVSGLNFEQYILTTPIVFAASTITSVGFGNIGPQTAKEIMFIIVIMILGHFFVSYILAQLTSALSARLTPKLLFHQKLLVVETFVRHNGLSTRLLKKLVEHYDLQHQYVSGCSLPEGTHLMYDAGKTLLEDVFLVEGEIFFDGVPAFAKIPSQAIIDMSRLMRRFVVPPDIVFIQRGEVRRVLYVIVNGSVALYQHGEETASAILTSTGHFGLRDLLFGEPYPYQVKTLSYVVLYAVDYSTFEEVLGDDEGLMEYISDEMERREDEIHAYLHTKIVADDSENTRQAVPPSWISYPDDPSKPVIGGDLTFDHYERPYLYFIGSNFIREKTMPDILHPAGLFGILWQATMGLAAVATFMTLVIELFMGYKGPNLRYFEIFLDLLFCADIFMKGHWAYYSYREGEMRYHPVKTWCRYIFHGPFFIEIAMTIPLELIIACSGATDVFGYGRGHSWFMKLRWIRFLRCYKFIELYVIVHRIFENRTTVMFLFYLSITVLMCFILSGLAFFFACPTFGYSWTPGDEYKMPVCLTGTWVDYKAEEKLGLRERYQPQNGAFRITEDDVFYARTFSERCVLGLYYVGQVLMVIGFGDLATFRRNELHFLTSVSLFGFIVCQAIVSDITSAQIDTDEIRAINREKLERLGIALSREGARKTFTMYVRKAFRLSWSYAKGLQPNDLFSDLHPILHRELLCEYFGDVLDRVPIFIGFTDAFVNALKVKLKIEYYPKGSLVTRAGDLDYRMYIIVKGAIWVCDRDDRWLCTLSTGESIGEMSLVYAAKRRFSAYAASNLQLLVLEAFDFASILEMYPLTRKDILQGLLQYKRESFLVKAWKMKAKDMNEYTKEQENNTQFVKKYFVQSASHIDVGGNVIKNEHYKVAAEPKWYQSFIGYGCNQNIQHYIYFSSDTDRFNFVIHPSCMFIVHFRTLVQVVRFCSPIIALFHVFFFFKDEFDSTVIQWTTLFGRIFDVMLWLNIALKFFTAIEVSERQTYCKDLRKIMSHYLLRPQGFLYDLIVAFPYDVVTGEKGTAFMLLRCLLSIKFFTELWKLKDDIEVSTLMFKLITSVSFLLYLAHILACIFFWLSCKPIGHSGDYDRNWTAKCVKNGWVYKFRIEFGKTYGSSTVPPPPGVSPSFVETLYEDSRPSHWYIISVYWVMAVLTTCGFGDITPTNFDEISLAVFCIFFGSLFLSIMLGNITTGLSSGNKAKREYLGRVEKMLEYLEVIGLSSVGHQTLGAYCNMTWNNCRGVNYNDIADILPLYVQQDVYLALFHECVTNCLFFGKGYRIDFVRAVCSRLRHYMFLPGMGIANELEPGTGIYIVMRGAVTSYQQNPETGNYEFIKRYEERQVFGRIPALYPGALYNKSYRAEDKTEVLLMYHADIRQILMKYPKWRIFLREMMAREYKYFSKQTTLKNITSRRLEMDEKLTKDLTIEQFTEGAKLFASQPPDRTIPRVNKDEDSDRQSIISVSEGAPETVMTMTTEDASERYDEHRPSTFNGSVRSIYSTNVTASTSKQSFRSASTTTSKFS